MSNLNSEISTDKGQTAEFYNEAHLTIPIDRIHGISETLDKIDKKIRELNSLTDDLRYCCLYGNIECNFIMNKTHEIDDNTEENNIKDIEEDK